MLWGSCVRNSRVSSEAILIPWSNHFCTFFLRTYPFLFSWGRCPAPPPSTRPTDELGCSPLSPPHALCFPFVYLRVKVACSMSKRGTGVAKSGTCVTNAICASIFKHTCAWLEKELNRPCGCHNMRGTQRSELESLARKEWRVS